MTSRVDAVVVGGGIVGCAAAYYLARAGLGRVRLVEADVHGAGATGGSFGGVRQQFADPLEVEFSRRGLAFWKTVEAALTSEKPDVRRLVGTEGNYGERMGLTRDWAARVIRLVGNYGEVYERTVGVDSALGIPRGINQLWNKGGILYAPPIR